MNNTKQTKLKPFAESDISEILALHRKLFANSNWTEQTVRLNLMDIARGQGRNTLVAHENGELVGVLGWVSDRVTHQFFGAPFFVNTEAAGDLFAAELIGIAKVEDAKFVRVGSFPDETKKITALKKAGFIHAFNFIDLELQIQKRPPDEKIDFEFVPVDQIDPHKYMELYNSSFRNISNAPPVTLLQAQELWKEANINPDLSGVWKQGDGTYIDFIIIRQDGYLDSIGIHPEFQNQGLGNKIYKNQFRKSYDLGMTRLTALIADNNKSSLNLHARHRFIELARRPMWQYDLK